MLDSGLRFTFAFLPAGVAVLVGLVLAVQRRRSQPEVAVPAVWGLALQLLAIVVAASQNVILPALTSSGSGLQQVLTVSLVIGAVTTVITVISWVLILTALFRRLPARAAAPASAPAQMPASGPGPLPVGPEPAPDDAPTGRHALLDEHGQQVVAQPGVRLSPPRPAAGGGVAAAGAVGAVGAAGAAGLAARPGPPPAASDEMPTEAVPVVPPPPMPDPVPDPVSAPEPDEAATDGDAPPLGAPDGSGETPGRAEHAATVDDAVHDESAEDTGAPEHDAEEAADGTEEPRDADPSPSDDDHASRAEDDAEDDEHDGGRTALIGGLAAGAGAAGVAAVAATRADEDPEPGTAEDADEAPVGTTPAEPPAPLGDDPSVDDPSEDGPSGENAADEHVPDEHPADEHAGDEDAAGHANSDEDDAPPEPDPSVAGVDESAVGGFPAASGADEGAADEDAGEATAPPTPGSSAATGVFPRTGWTRVALRPSPTPDPEPPARSEPATGLGLFAPVQPVGGPATPGTPPVPDTSTIGDVVAAAGTRVGDDAVPGVPASATATPAAPAAPATPSEDTRRPPPHAGGWSTPAPASPPGWFEPVTESGSGAAFGEPREPDAQSGPGQNGR